MYYTQSPALTGCVPPWRRRSGYPRRVPRVGPPRPDLTVVEVDDEISIFNPTTGRAVLLNQTASDVWLLCDGTLDLDGILDRLALAYGRSPEQLRPDVLEAIDRFRAEQLLPRSADVQP